MNDNNDENNGNSNKIEPRLNHLEKRMDLYDKKRKNIKVVLIIIFSIWLLLFLVGVIQFIRGGS
ncbi:hypothetical protein D3C76_227770 [compost metagenome]